MALRPEVKVYLRHTDARRQKHIIHAPQRRAKCIADPAPAAAAHAVGLTKHERRIGRIGRCHLRNILGYVEPEGGVVGEQVKAHAQPALRVTCRLRVEMDSVRINDPVLRVDKPACCEIDDIEIIDLVLLVRHPRRVCKGRRLEFWRRGVGTRVPVCRHDICSKVVELLNVLRNIPPWRPPFLVDEVVDFVTQLKKNHLVTQRVPNSFSLCLCIAPVAAVVCKVERIDDVCPGGKVVCKGRVPVCCNVTALMTLALPFFPFPFGPILYHSGFCLCDKYLQLCRPITIPTARDALIQRRLIARRAPNPDRRRLARHVGYLLQKRCHQARVGIPAQPNRLDRVAVRIANQGACG